MNLVKAFENKQFSPCVCMRTCNVLSTCMETHNSISLCIEVHHVLRVCTEPHKMIWVYVSKYKLHQRRTNRAVGSNTAFAFPSGLWEAMLPLLPRAGCGKQYILCLPKRAVGSNTPLASQKAGCGKQFSLCFPKWAVGSNRSFTSPSVLWKQGLCSVHKVCALCTRALLCVLWRPQLHPQFCRRQGTVPTSQPV